MAKKPQRSRAVMESDAVRILMDRWGNAANYYIVRDGVKLMTDEELKVAANPRTTTRELARRAKEGPREDGTRNPFWYHGKP